MQHRRWAPYRTWMAYTAAWGFTGSLAWAMTPVLLVRDLGLSPLELVLVGTALEVAYFAAEVPTGVMADLVSRRLSMVVSCAVQAAGMVVLGVGGSFAWAVVGSAVWGVGWTFRSGAEDAWLADELGTDHLGRAYQRGAQVERVAMLAGIAAAVGLAVVDLRAPLVAAAACAVGLGVVVTVVMPENGFTPPPPTAVPARGRAAVHRALASAAWTLRTGTRLVRRDAVLGLVLGVALLSGAWSEGWDRLWQAHLLEDVRLPALGTIPDFGWLGVLEAVSLLAALVVAAPLVPRIERLEQHRLAHLLLVLHAVLVATALGFALSGSLLPAAAAYLATQVARSLTDAPYRTWLSMGITDSSVRATVLSLVGMTGGVGEAAGGPVIGWVGSRWSIRAALVTGAVALLPVLALFARAGRARGRAGGEVGVAPTSPPASGR